MALSLKAITLSTRVNTPKPEMYQTNLLTYSIDGTKRQRDKTPYEVDSQNDALSGKKKQKQKQKKRAAQAGTKQIPVEISSDIESKDKSVLIISSDTDDVQRAPTSSLSVLAAKPELAPHRRSKRVRKSVKQFVPYTEDKRRH